MRASVLLKSSSFGLIISIVLLSVPLSLMADTPTFRGTLTQGMTFSEGNPFLNTDEDELGFNLTEAVIGGDIRASASARFAGQIVFYNLGDSSNQLELDYLFLEENMWSGSSGNFGIRLGRNKNSYGLYNATRDVGFTRPGTFMPQSIYLNDRRNLMISADGILLYGNHFNEMGDWSFELGTGKPRANKLADIELGDTQFKNESYYLSQLMFESTTGRYLFGLSAIEASTNVKVNYASSINSLGIDPSIIETINNLNLDPALIEDALTTQGDGTLTAIILSAQYNLDHWSFTTEFQRVDIDWNLDPISIPAIPLLNFPGVDKDLSGRSTEEGYYIQATRHLDSHWSLYGRLEQFYSEIRDRSGTQYTSDTGLPNYYRFTKTLTAGIRWDINESFMLRAEASHYDGAAILLPTYPTEDQYVAKKWQAYAIELNYRF